MYCGSVQAFQRLLPGFRWLPEAPFGSKAFLFPVGCVGTNRGAAIRRHDSRNTDPGAAEQFVTNSPQ